jgi:hypothetical protein
MSGFIGAAMDRPFPIISQSFKTVLLLVLATDLAFVLLDLIAFGAEKAHWIAVVPSIIKITRDGALPELVGYLKWAVIIVALVWLSIRDGWSVPFRWALVFLIILIDDSLQIHETLGHMLWDKIPFPPSLHARGEDLSEIVAFAGMGVVAVALTATLFVRHGPVARALSIRFLQIVAGLVFFGVLLDFLHQLISTFSQGTAAAGILPPFFSLLEDGGEMVIASVALAFVLTLPGFEVENRALTV